MCLCGLVESKPPKTTDDCKALSPSGIFATGARVLPSARVGVGVLIHAQNIHKHSFQVFLYFIKGLNSANMCLTLLQNSFICSLHDLEMSKT